MDSYSNGRVAAPAADRLPQLIRPGTLLDAWRADAEAAHLAHTTGQPRGPITGLRGLDSELGGALSPGLHVLHASPGVGKTALALQIAASARCPALYVTLEMGPLELFRRITARLTSTYLGRLKSGELDPAQSLALARQAAEATPHLAFADGTEAWPAPAWLQDAARVVRGESPHLLVVVDSVHSWAEGAPEALPEYEALNAGLAALRGLARTLACPILAIAERNRASMTKGGLSAGAGTRKLEYGGESVLSLTREDAAADDAQGRALVTLVIEKNRNGAPGVGLRLRFHGALQRWDEAER